MKTYYEKAESGRSMIEMLGVLAIVGILSAGGIAGYSMAMQHHKTNTLIERIQLIVTKTKTIYKNGNYNGVSNQNLIDSGKLSAKDLENPFGGNLNVKDAVCLRIDTEQNIPISTCIDVLTTDWGEELELFRVNNRTNVFYPQKLLDVISECKFTGNENKSLILCFY